MTILIDFLRGVAIGLANIIPGVSGGTMALILGIYERLIAALHNIGPQTLRALFQGRAALVAELRRIDAGFLAALGAGAVVAILSVAKLMLYLLENQHDPTYGFFFGLILASVVFPYRLIRKKSAATLVAALLAIAVVVGITASLSGERMLRSAERKAAMKADVAGEVATPEAATFDVGRIAVFFAAGAIAISAMILPGISGSFVLLLLGLYFEVLSAVNGLRSFGPDWLVHAAPLAAFALGCVIGLLAFTRLLNALMRRFHDVTMAFLLGLVIGSLYAIWPFQRYAMVAGERIDLGQVFPTTFGANELLTLVAAGIGVLVVGAFLVVELRMQAGAQRIASTG